MADGQYANLAVITHSFAEFVIDFVNVMPNVPKAKVKSRVIMTPQHAKRLMRDPRAEERAHQAFDALVQSLATAANGEPASTHS